MTSLSDKAETTRDVRRASEAAGAYRLETDELTPADDIGSEDDFPQYGDFADVTVLGMDGSDHDPCWLETPAGLARALLDADVGPGDLFVVDGQPTKDDGGNWTFDVLDPDDVDGFDADD